MPTRVHAVTSLPRARLRRRRCSVDTAVMQTAEGLVRITREAVEDLAADNVCYAELRYAPEQHQADGPPGAQQQDQRGTPVRGGVAERLLERLTEGGPDPLPGAATRAPSTG